MDDAGEPETTPSDTTERDRRKHKRRGNTGKGKEKANRLHMTRDDMLMSVHVSKSLNVSKEMHSTCLLDLKDAHSFGD